LNADGAPRGMTQCVAFNGTGLKGVSSRARNERMTWTHGGRRPISTVRGGRRSDSDLATPDRYPSRPCIPALAASRRLG